MKLATTIEEMYSYTGSPAEAIRQYEGSGFRYLDYSFYDVVRKADHPFMKDTWQTQIREAKDTADELGFTFVQAHAPACALLGEQAEAGMAATKRSIEACGMLGIHNMVIHSGFSEKYRYPQDQVAYFKANEPFFRSLIPTMEQYQVSILFENTTYKHTHGGDYFPITGQDLVDFVEFMDHPLFGAAWDVGHANMDDKDHYKEVMAMGKHLKALHIHDNDGTKDQHMAPFWGTMDFDSLMQGLIDSNYSGYFTFESVCFLKYDRNCHLKDPNGRLAHPPLEIKKAALSFLYTIGKSILEAYNLYEE